MKKYYQVSRHIGIDHYCLSKRHSLSNRNDLSIMDQGEVRNNMRAGLLLVLSILKGKKYILPFLIYPIALAGVAQNLTIKKIILSETDRQPIKFASIAIRNSNKGTYTNLSGEFTISCGNTDSLTISAIGYRKGIYHCASLPDTILLKDEMVQLPEIVVSSRERKQRSVSMGLHNMKRTGAYTGAIAAALYIVNTERLNVHLSKALFQLSKVTWIYSTKPKLYKLLVRLKLYKLNEFYKGPGEEIITNNIVEEVSETQTEIVFDIESLNIELPADGIFIALEFLGYYNDNQFNAFSSNDQNKYIQYKASFTDQYSAPASWIRLNYENDWQPLETGATVYNFNFGIEVK